MDRFFSLCFAGFSNLPAQQKTVSRHRVVKTLIRATEEGKNPALHGSLILRVWRNDFRPISYRDFALFFSVCTLNFPDFPPSFAALVDNTKLHALLRCEQTKHLISLLSSFSTTLWFFSFSSAIFCFHSIERLWAAAENMLSLLSFSPLLLFGDVFVYFAGRGRGSTAAATKTVYKRFHVAIPFIPFSI